MQQKGETRSATRKESACNKHGNPGKTNNVPVKGWQNILKKWWGQRSVQQAKTVDNQSGSLEYTMIAGKRTVPKGITRALNSPP